MSNQIVNFENAQLPSFIVRGEKVVNPFAQFVQTKFKVLSLNSKVFTVIDGDSQTLITAPGDPDTPASSVEVVIVASNPNESRVYYKGGYEPGSGKKPTCYSNDGIAPSPNAIEPQSKKCMTCPHARYGSRITDSGKQSYACSKSMRLAIAPAGQLDDLMLLRVPPSSLKNLGRYGQELARRGVLPHQVVTQIKFDYSVSYPALIFTPKRFVTEAMYQEIMDLRISDTVKYITGIEDTPLLDGDDTLSKTEIVETESVKPEPEPVQKVEPVKKVEPAKKAEPVKKAEPATPVEAEKSVEPQGVDTIDDLDFDD